MHVHRQRFFFKFIQSKSVSCVIQQETCDIIIVFGLMQFEILTICFHFAPIYNAQLARNTGTFILKLVVRVSGNVSVVFHVSLTRCAEVARVPLGAQRAAAGDEAGTFVVEPSE